MVKNLSAKAKDRIEKAQEYQAQKELKELQDKGDSVGIIIDEFSKLNPPAQEAIDLIKPVNGKYRIDQQHFALMFLEVFQKEDVHTGDLKPMFANVSGMLNIAPATLKFWWGKKEEIMAKQSAVMKQGMEFISTSFTIELIRMSQALSKVDYTEMLASGKPADAKNFISLLNTLVNKVRLLTNQSTTNVAHKHQVQMVIPGDD